MPALLEICGNCYWQINNYCTQKWQDVGQHDTCKSWKKRLIDAHPIYAKGNGSIIKRNEVTK